MCDAPDASVTGSESTWRAIRTGKLEALVDPSLFVKGITLIHAISLIVSELFEIFDAFALTVMTVLLFLNSTDAEVSEFI